MNGSENYERNVWTDDDLSPEEVYLDSCRCTVISGGAVAWNPACPIHRGEAGSTATPGETQK